MKVFSTMSVPACVSGDVMKLSIIGRNLGRAISVPFRFLSPMTASLFDKRAARYWQGLPLHRMIGVLLAFFFTFSGFAFLLDLFN